MLTETTLNFELRDRIGRGGFGEVYMAHDPQLNAIIAVKKIRIDSFTNPDAYFDESRKLYLTKHANICPVIYSCRDINNVYLSMPFFKNGSLKTLMSNRFLTSKEIVRYALQFLSGLNHIHTKGLLHFDVKTENILINDSNQAVISDFGLAMYTGRYGFANNLATTRIFAPPEILTQTQHNLKFDIYQAGFALYRMCNGDQIIVNQFEQAHIRRGLRNNDNFEYNLTRGNFPNRSFYLPHIPKQLRKIISQAMNNDPNLRQDSILQILKQLSSLTTLNDWQYSQNEANLERWVREGFDVTCIENDNILTILALKNGRRVKEYCKTIASDEKADFLHQCLNNI